MLSVILLFTQRILLSTLKCIMNLICGKNELTSEFKSDVQGIVEWGRKWY